MMGFMFPDACLVPDPQHRWRAAMSGLRALVASLAVAMAVVAPAAGQTPGQTPAMTAPADADIRKILADRIDVHRQGVGMVVGVVDATGRRVVAHGVLAAGDTRQPDGDTIFEIGSMTKVFTSLLLADAV